MSIVENTQFTGTDQEAEASEQQYHLCLTSESRLRATVSKASAWITGPCSRSRHTFSSFSYHYGVLMPCVRVVSYAVTRVCRTVATLPLHREGRALPPFAFDFFLFFDHSRRVYYYSLGKVQRTSSTRCQEEAFPSRRVHHGKEMDVPATFSGVVLNSADGIRANSPRARLAVSSSRITVVLRFLSGI